MFLETFASVVVLAIVTGVPYIKFSKPASKVMFADPVINRGVQGPQLQIRICMDTQHACLINARFKLTLAWTKRSPMGTVRVSAFDRKTFRPPARLAPASFVLSLVHLSIRHSHFLRSWH